MAIIGIEEIFLKVKDMEKAIEFYHGILGIPLDKHRTGSGPICRPSAATSSCRSRTTPAATRAAARSTSP